MVIIISEICYLSFIYVIFVVTAGVKHRTTSDIPGWMELQWSEGGPRDESDYLTFSLASFLVLLLILSGDIELNPGPETVKY